MRNAVLVSFTAVVLGCVFSPTLWAQQSDQPKGVGEELAKRKWNNSPPLKQTYANKPKAAPAPRRDISGTWDGWAEGGTEAKGPIEYPAVIKGRPQDDFAGQPDEADVEHPLPYTAAGLAALKKNKPGVGVRAVDSALINDPANVGNPSGFPRMLFYEFRVFEWIRFKNQMVYLDQFGQNYRIVWTDGRPLPDINEVAPRFFGYSVGKWTDDYTFEIDTVGVNDTTWLDNAGRPHTYQMKVREIWHRVDYDTMELTVTVDDPQYYSAKWKGLDKYIVHRLPDTYDPEEFIYNGSETADYNSGLAEKVSSPSGK